MIYVVSGFMRSGTSMMMRACEAGGMEVVRSPERERFNEEHRDGSYLPNPGIYEPNYAERFTPGWPRQYDGKVIKVVAPFLPWLAAHEYRVVFMRRNPEEIRQSYRAAFPGEPEAKRVSEACDEAIKLLSIRRDVTFCELEYGAVLANPREALRSLDWPLDCDKAATVVDASRHRFKLEKLVVGL